MSLQKFSNGFPSLINLVRNNSDPVYSDYTTFLSSLKTYNHFHPICVKINIRYPELVLSTHPLMT